MPARSQTQPVTGDTIYGEGILAGEIARLGACAVITSPTPWALHADAFAATPHTVLMPGTLEQAELDAIEPRIDDGLRIVGLGGGSALDMAKYLAHRRGQPSLLIPTVASSNGPFSDWISIRRDGRPNGFREPGLPRRVIVDYPRIQQADARVNRAGYGDLLPLQTTLNDWRLAAAAGRVDPIDPDIEAACDVIIRQALAAADDIGSLSTHGIETLVRLTEASTALMLTHADRPLNAGSEHLFAWTLESLTRRHVLHGELVALGIVITSWLQGRDHDVLTGALDTARVTWRPAELGLDWTDIEQTLLGVQEYNRTVRQYHTVLDDVIWTPELLRDVRDVVSSAPSRRGAP